LGLLEVSSEPVAYSTRSYFRSRTPVAIHCSSLISYRDVATLLYHHATFLAIIARAYTLCVTRSPSMPQVAPHRLHSSQACRYCCERRYLLNEKQRCSMLSSRLVLLFFGDTWRRLSESDYDSKQALCNTNLQKVHNSTGKSELLLFNSAEFVP
jgi:hypothetical protein